MKKTPIFIISLILASSAGAAAAAEDDAEQGPPGDNGIQANNLFPDTPESSAGISRRQASDLARDRYQGRVLSIRMDEDNRWRVRIDQDGRVFNVFVDAESGEISRPR